MPFSGGLSSRVNQHLILDEPRRNASGLQTNLHYIAGCVDVRIDVLLSIFLGPLQLVDHPQRVSKLVLDAEGLENAQLLIADEDLIGSCADEDVGIVMGHAPALPCGPFQGL